MSKGQVDLMLRIDIVVVISSIHDVIYYFYHDCYSLGNACIAFVFADRVSLSPDIITV